MKSLMAGFGIRGRLRVIVKIITGTLSAAGRRKIFCIGLNKTGTTSMEHALLDLGYSLGDVVLAEAIAERDWWKRDFRALIRYCHTAQAFQDAPFRFPYTYQALDKAFPKSRFILTVRDSADQWYKSITGFHSKKWGDGRSVPDAEKLKEAFYHSKGRPWRMNRMLFNTPESEPYKKDILIEYYERHNAAVIEYFRHRPYDLLVLNVAEPGAYRRLCKFLGRPCDKEVFPWKNKT